MSAPRRLLRALGAVVVALFVLQVALVTAFLLGLAGSSAGLGLRVEGGDRLQAGMPWALVVTAWAGPGQPWQRPLEILVADADGERACRVAGHAWVCRGRAPSEPGAVPITVRARGADPADTRSGAEHAISLPVEAPSGAALAPYLAAVTPRGRSVAGRDIEPSVTADDARLCGGAHTVVPETGVAEVNVAQRWFVLGPPGAARGEVICEVGQDPPTRLPARFDALGVAEVSYAARWHEDWRCAAACEGSGPARVDVVPAWDGISIAPERPVLLEGTPNDLVVAHQRDFGGWFLALWCDGVLVDATGYLAEAGRYPFAWAPPAVGGGSPRLCTLQASTSLVGVPASRSAHAVLVRSVEADEVAALRALAESSQAAPAPVAALGAAVVAAIDAGQRDGLRAAGLALLAAVPQRWSALQVVLDGVAERSAAWEAERARLAGVAVRLLVADFALLVVAVVGLIVPGVRERRRVLAAMADDAEHDADDLARLERAARRTLLLAVPLALGVVLILTVAMRTLLVAIW